MSIEVRAQNTLSMTSVKAIKDAVDETDRMVSYIDQSVYGTITYEYNNNGTIETVYKRDDGTYYYIHNGVEVTVAESDLERDSETGQLLTDREKDGLDTTIEQAQEFATEAHTLAEQAQVSADDAQTSADKAYGYATSAYNQLADIEKVVDVLEWTAQHGEYALTPDAEVQTDKYYFTRTGYGGGTYNGSMVTFETQAGNNISSVTADIEPIQSGSGTPSPTNVRPISGHTDVVVSRTGKNLCDTSLVYNGYINVSQQKIASNANARTLYLRCKPNTTYTVSKQAGQRFAVAESTEIPTNNVVVSNIVSDYTASSITITTSASAKYLVAFVYLSTADTGVTADQMLATCQIELGSRATTYEPYQGDTYTTALGTTVYGGTLDVTTGVLTVDKAIVTYDGTEDNWQETTGSGFRQYFITVSGMKNSQTAISDSFQGIALSERSSKTGMVLYTDTYVRFSLLNDFCTANGIRTVPTWKTWLSNNNIQVVYELATPQTYQLTAQQITALQGVNNVWANSGDISVVVKDTYSYPLVNNPTGNPSAQGWYELTGVDQAITQYVATHLALTDDGLYVQVDNSSSKIQITGSGVYLWNTGKRIAQYTNEVVLGDIDDVHIVLSPTNGLEFYQGASKVAWITANTMHIQQAEIESNLRIGQFLWKVQSANRISLVYAPQ